MVGESVGLELGDMVGDSVGGSEGATLGSSVLHLTKKLLHDSRQMNFIFFFEVSSLNSGSSQYLFLLDFFLPTHLQFTSLPSALMKV